MNSFLHKCRQFFMKGHVALCLKSIAINAYNICVCFGMIWILSAWISLEIICLFLGIIIEIIALPIRLYEKYFKKIGVLQDLGKME